MGLEFDHGKIPLYKLVLHIIQIVISVTIWCLEIAVFKGGDINGNNGWTFGVVCLPSTTFSAHSLLTSSPDMTKIIANTGFFPQYSAFSPPQHGYI